VATMADKQTQQGRSSRRSGLRGKLTVEIILRPGRRFHLRTALTTEEVERILEALPEGALERAFDETKTLATLRLK